MGSPHYRGPAPVGSRDSLGRTALAIKRIKGERDRGLTNWFTQKANKAPAQDMLCSHRPQAPSRIAEGAPP